MPDILMPEDLRRPFTYATRRNPALRTRGGKIGVVAKELGRSLYPHQQYIADVIGELNPEGSRLKFRYQTVIISEPRQVGKTTLIRPLVVDRTLTQENIITKFTAQKGKDARERWQDMIGDIRTSHILGGYAKVREGKGDEALTWPNGSTIKPFAPTEDGVHGGSPDMVGIDECWAFDMETGKFLQAAIRPSMITRTARQVLYYSAAGNADSEWWESLRALGRAATQDPNSTIAYFEHSMDESLDPLDPDSWDFHPGLDGLITKADIQAELDNEMPHEEFLRAYMNIPTKISAEDLPIDPDAFDALGEDDPVAPGKESVAVGFEVAIDKTTASVWAAWLSDDGMLHMKVMRTEDGTDWLEPFLTDLDDAGYKLHADDGGQTRVWINRLRNNHVNVTTPVGRDASTLWQNFKDHVEHKRLRHDKSPAMRKALEVLVEKKIADVMVPDRSRSRGAIDPPIAGAVALWYAERLNNTPQIF